MTDMRVLPTEKVLLEGILEAIEEVGFFNIAQSGSRPYSVLRIHQNVAGGANFFGTDETIKYTHNGIILPDSLGHRVQIVHSYNSLGDIPEVQRAWSDGVWSIWSIMSGKIDIALFDTELKRWYK